VRSGDRQGREAELQLPLHERCNGVDNQIAALQSTWALAGSSCSSRRSPSGRHQHRCDAVAWPARPAPGTSPTGGGGWIYAPDTTRPVRRSSPPVQGRTSATTPTRQPRQCSIKLTNTSSSLKALYNYENYLAKNLPGHLATGDGSGVQRGRQDTSAASAPENPLSPGSPRTGTSAGPAEVAAGPRRL